MRKTLPITTVAYLSDDTLVASRTVAGGRPVSTIGSSSPRGFTEAELMGQPHSIIRHPDVPPEPNMSMGQSAT